MIDRDLVYLIIFVIAITVVAGQSYPFLVPPTHAKASAPFLINFEFVLVNQ
jgi:biopolymer transport protein ExbD